MTAGERHPDFESGNAYSLKHGATSPGRVQPRADEWAAEFLEIAPWLRVRAFSAAVRDWAWCEAQSEILRAWIDEHSVAGLDVDERTPIAAQALLDRVATRAERLRGRLGLDHAAYSKLIARLGAANGEVAARGLESLREVGRALANTAALPEATE